MTTGCLNNVMLTFINLILHLCCMFNNYVHNLSIYLVKTIAQDFLSKHQFRGTASAHTGFYCIRIIILYIIMYIIKCLLLLVKAPSLPIILHDILVTKCIDILWNLHLYNIRQYKLIKYITITFIKSNIKYCDAIRIILQSIFTSYRFKVF